MKRIEIVIDNPHVPRALDRLLEAGVAGYTVLPNVSGYGERGEQRADDVSGVSSNAYILVAVPQEQLEAVTRLVQPLLKSYGGICLISDCLWLEH